MKDALGHGSNAHGSGIAALPPKMSADEFKQLVAKSRADSERTDKITQWVTEHRVGEFNHPSGRMMLISPSFEHSGLRATSFDEKGEALGHREYPAHDNLGLRSEVSMALSGGYKLNEDEK